MAVPELAPDRRDPAQIAAPESYRPADPVWVYRGGAWRAGVVEAASGRAVTVRYRPTAGHGTGVDTLTAAYLQARADFDPLLDGREPHRRR